MDEVLHNSNEIKTISFWDARNGEKQARLEEELSKEEV